MSLFSYYLTKINREGLAVLAREVRGFSVSFMLKFQTQAWTRADSIYQSAALLPPAAASLLLTELLV